jgi:hypothetical protein
LKTATRCDNKVQVWDPWDSHAVACHQCVTLTADAETSPSNLTQLTQSREHYSADVPELIEDAQRRILLFLKSHAACGFCSPDYRPAACDRRKRHAKDSRRILDRQASELPEKHLILPWTAAQRVSSMPKLILPWSQFDFTSSHRSLTHLDSSRSRRQEASHALSRFRQTSTCHRR